MRTVILSFTLMICMTISIIIVLGVCSRSIYYNELSKSVDHAMISTLAKQFEEDEFTNSEAEFRKRFYDSFELQIRSDSEVAAEIIQLDIMKGLLSVEAKSEFYYPTGVKSEVNVKRTVIMEQHREEGFDEILEN